MLNCSGVSRHQTLPVRRTDPPSGSSVRTSTFPSSMRYSFAGEPSPDSRRSRTFPNDMVSTLAPFLGQNLEMASNPLAGNTAKSLMLGWGIMYRNRNMYSKQSQFWQEPI